MISVSYDYMNSELWAYIGPGRILGQEPRDPVTRAIHVKYNYIFANQKWSITLGICEKSKPEL